MSLPAGFARALVEWQRRAGRHALPWQGTRDPYRVWLSEIMLQQTQVATVIGYYGRFVERFPDVAALAAAPLDDVLALWSGLGYYSRARLLHRCAIEVCERHGGRFPARAAGLAELPGIGRSTAAAIAAFCFGERVAILDGNVKRVLTRVLGFDADLSLPANERALWVLAEAALPQRDVDVYTQAVMDLGATVCTARRPLCGDCPVAARCVARAQGEPQRYPVKGRRLRRGTRDNSVLLLSRGDAVWLVPRPARGVWGGLWSLPEFDDFAALAATVDRWPGDGRAMPAIHHTLTHFDWTLRPWWLPLSATADVLSAIASRWPEGRWVAARELAGVGLPAPIRALLAGLFSVDDGAPSAHESSAALLP